MVATGAVVRAEGLAQDLFGIITQFCLTLPRNQRRSGELKELEFLTLTILRDHGTMIVGHIQRQLGILPAQMSRIIRALEARDRPLISCRINSHDKRKIDVTLTPEGEKTLGHYQAIRVGSITNVLGSLSEEDQEEFGRLLELLRERIDRGPNNHE